MRVVTGAQGDTEWRRARCGLITASRMAHVLDFPKTKKGEEGAKRRNYRIELMTERFTGRANEHYVSEDMENGTELEPYAISAYEAEKRVMARSVGFVLHPTLDFSGASPDSLLGEDGALECKCPRATTHMRWKEEARSQEEAGEPVTVPENHQAQCLWVMKCAERQWVDFVSYCPSFPKGLDLHIVRMFRDDKRLAEIEAQVIRFEKEINASMDYWRQFIQIPEPPPFEEREDAPPIEFWASRFAEFTGMDEIPL